MIRRLLNLLTALSLLLCVAVTAAWVRSDYCLLHGRYNRSPGPDETHALFFGAESFAGTLTFTFGHRYFGPVYLRGLSEEATRTFGAWYPPGLRWDAAGGEKAMLLSAPAAAVRARHNVDTRSPGYRSDDWVLAVPHWLPAALLGVMPAVWLNRFRKTRRVRRPGLCRTCGYDLTGNASGVCPECGTSR
jgi:hypothetical protein